MLKLLPNGRQIIAKEVHNDSIKSAYYCVCSAYSRGYNYEFASQLQILITKVGLVMGAGAGIKASAYCAGSIDFLCNKVLDNATLCKTFKSLGINAAGNKTKHSLNEVKCDMNKWAATYNSMINLIVKKYNLPQLKVLIVSKFDHGAQKNSADRPENYQAYYQSLYNIQQPQPVKQKPKHKKHNVQQNNVSSNPVSSESKNEICSLKAEFAGGIGVFTKGIIRKEQLLNFKVKYNLNISSRYQVKSVHMTFISGNPEYVSTRSIGKEKSSTVDFNVPYVANNLITIKVSAVVKVGTFKTKTIETTIKKHF